MLPGRKVLTKAAAGYIFFFRINSACQQAEVAQSVEQGTENPRVGSSILPLGTICELVCGSGSVVEHRLAKARVAGSNPVFRSIFWALHDRRVCWLWILAT